jgi:hypothetical protein
MPKSSIQTYSLIEISSNSNNLQIPSKNNDQSTKNPESSSSEHGSSARVRFLEPYSANNTKPILSRSPKSFPSFESIEGSSFDNANDLHQDGPNSVSRGLQTDISSASVIDWVLAQKSSSTAERYIKTQFISDMMHKCT